MARDFRTSLSVWCERVSDLVTVDLKTTLRRCWNRAVLNRRLTDVYDRIWPLDTLGDRGERCAERFLLKQGLIIVERSYRDELGEIDLIAVDQRTVVFVEVKTRLSNVAGEGFEAVDVEKQRRIVRTALSYLKRHHLQECRSRFDVISILWKQDSEDRKIAHFPDAFQAEAGCW